MYAWHKHTSIVHNLPLASRRTIHPSVCASEGLHIPEMPLCWGGSDHPPALLSSFCSPPAGSTLALANISVAAYCTLQIGQLLLIHRQPLHLSFSSPCADFIAVLELRRPGWEALSAAQIAREIMQGKEAEAKGASQNDTSQKERRESVHRKGLCSCRMFPVEERQPWTSQSATHMLPVFSGLQCWLSPSSLLLQEEISEKHLLDFNFFLCRCPVTLTLKSLHYLKAGIQRACCKLSCEDCSDRQCSLPAADSALNIVRPSLQTLLDK